MARHSALEIATGAAVLLVAGGFLVFAVANTGQHLAGAGYTLHADFDHADGLSAGAEVRVAGVKVGNVEAIQLNPKTYLADVAFSVQRDVQLSTDSSATISTDGLLGGKYLALATGGEDARLPPGGTITITPACSAGTATATASKGPASRPSPDRCKPAPSRSSRSTRAAQPTSSPAANALAGAFMPGTPPQASSPAAGQGAPAGR